MTQQEQRTRHYGFAMIPRIVIRGEKYKSLSLAHKGLYQGLKDICGEEGECYYSLRNLAKALHSSPGTLCRHIRELATAGLILAEKKLRGNGANRHEVWHLRIVDIWDANDLLYSPNNETKSVSECNTSVAIGNSVSKRNNPSSTNVSKQNKDCFKTGDKEYLESKDTVKEKDTQKKSDVSLDAKITSTSSPSQDQQEAVTEQPSPIATSEQQDSLFPVVTYESEDEWKLARSEYMAYLALQWKQAPASTRDRYKTLSVYRTHEIGVWQGEHPCPPKIALTPEEVVIWERWNTLFRKPVPLSAAAKKACADLVPCDPSADDLRAAWHYCRENDRNGFYAKRGVRIWDVAREYEGWYMLHEAQRIAEEKKRNVIQASERFTPPPLMTPVPYEQTRAYLEQQRNEIRAQQRKQVLV